MDALTSLMTMTPPAGAGPLSLFPLIATVVTLAAVLAFINSKLLRLPSTIGVMLLALVVSAVLIGVGNFVPAVADWAERVLGSVQLEKTLLHGVLGYLLFAGALHLDINELLAQRWVVGSLASVGVVLSIGIVAGLVWLVLRLPVIDLPLPFLHCLVFGTLIAPTDPIAVMGILESLGAPASVETKIAGESLFNDGVAVVVFLALVAAAGLDPAQATGGSMAGVVALFLQETVGGALFGLAAGYAVYRMLAVVDHYQVEILLTLALVTGGYALAMAWHLSGPIAMVVAGLLIGNRGRRLAMSEITRRRLDAFWEVVDEILNTVLFVLIGLEVIVLTFTGAYLLAGLLAIPIVVLARLIAVATPIALLRLRREFTPHVVKILTWGGLRGGISVALALSLPAFALPGGESGGRELLVAMTYVVVLFSVIVQGGTVGALVRRWLPDQGSAVEGP